MSISLNSQLADSTTYSGSGASPSFSFTVNSGTNTVLYVAVFSNQVISAVAYNSVSMTSVASVSLDGGASQVFRLKAPSTGANSVAITLSASGIMIANAFAFDGVDQTTPESGAIQGYYGGASPISQSISSTSGDWGVLVIADRGSDTNNTFAGSGGSTLISGTNQSNWLIASAYLASTGSTVSPAISYSGGSTNSIEYMGFDLTADGGAGSGTSLTPTVGSGVLAGKSSVLDLGITPRRA